MAKDLERYFTELQRLNYYLRFDYDNASSFFENIAIAIRDGKSILINETGKEITLPIYDGIYSLEGNKNIVKLNNKYGIINETGKIILPIEYDYIYTLEIVKKGM